MMYPHRIRLRGPWEQDTPEGPRRVILPGPFPEGQSRLRRRFGYPGQLDAHERAWLIIEGLTTPATVFLNGHPVQAESDITSQLRARNELTIETQGGWTEVALEIRALAYLRYVTGGLAEGRTHVSGEVVGEAQRPLDLYLLAGRGTVAYISITPTSQGQPFELSGPALQGPVRVELVSGSVIWWKEELSE